MNRLQKNLLFLGMLVYYLGGYFLVAELTARRGHYHHLALPFEERLPFYPALIFVYLLVFGYLALPYLVIDEPSFFRKVVLAFFVDEKTP